MKTISLSRREFMDLSMKGIAFAVLIPSCIKKGNDAAFGYNYPFKHKNTSALINDPNAYVQVLLKFTETYKKFPADQTELREAECLKAQLFLTLCDIEENDLFAGRDHHPCIGFNPQTHYGSFGYYYDANTTNQRLLSNPNLTAENKKLLLEIIEYWKTENCNYKTRREYTPKMIQALPSDDWFHQPLIAAPLYRMSGTQLDFDKLLQLGIPGLRAEIQLHKKKKNTDSIAMALYDSMEKALDLLCAASLYYADMSHKMSETAADSQRRNDLKEMEKALGNIASSKPANLREAIQLMWMYVKLSGTNSFARMDVYLGDFYANDLKQGTITEAEALRMLKSLWMLIDGTEEPTDGRVIVGGKGRRNEANADAFALLAIKATEEVHGILPQFTLRFYKEQNPELFKRALDSIGSGNPYPMLYNDDMIVPAVQAAFNLPYEEAVDYLPFGCGEYIIWHKSVGTPSGIINLLQALSITLHHGINTVTQKPMGIAASEIGSFKTFDDLYSAYKKQLKFHIEQSAIQQKLEYDIAGQTAPFLFLSMLFDDCIERGKGVFSGGIRYLGGTYETYGNTNTADSLTAIKKLVYEDKKMTLDEMIHILDKNFEGYEKERKEMLDAPKFGNDDDYADSMRVELDHFVNTTVKDQNKPTGMHSYLVVIINNSANTILGLHTPASSDGRKAFTYMANANNPSGGSDKNGITAFLNSLVKPDIKLHAGAVQNMKFSKEMFTVYREKTEALLKTYFEIGGAQCMINCIGREDLENAMKHPEKYASLVVRVGGFSARFIDLDRHVQEEILSRTLY